MVDDGSMEDYCSIGPGGEPWIGIAVERIGTTGSKSAAMGVLEISKSLLESSIIWVSSSFWSPMDTGVIESRMGSYRFAPG